MNYEETLTYINSITWRGSKLGLERIIELLDLLNNPQKDLKFIHIAGTNGKGSTAAMLSSILVSAGYKTGLFTSPYIERFNERMQINNLPIADDELAEITTYIRPYAETLEDLPTEFELNTAVGLEYFKRNECDIVILEVGMGGALDSTNVIDSPLLAIITAIGLDHINELGGTIEAIAKAKAGIIKEGCHVVAYGQDEVVENILMTESNNKNAKYYTPEFNKIELISRTINNQCFNYNRFENLNIPLIGTYQLNNAAVVLTAIEVLNSLGWNISDNAVEKGLMETKWPGRFEVLSHNPTFIVDGAHNPHGIRATKESLDKHFKGLKIVFLMGIMEDKDIEDMLHVIIPIAQEIITVTPDNPRAMPAKQLAELIISKGGIASPCYRISEAVDKAKSKAGINGVVCAIGSLYMVGDVRAYVLNK